MPDREQLIERLGFHIENRGPFNVLVYPNDSCRVASSPEIALWKALERDAAVLERIEQLCQKITPGKLRSRLLTELEAAQSSVEGGEGG